MKMWVGTSGYSYKEWKGSFYPEKIAAGDMLPYYASQLPAVEINNTFYRLPRADVVKAWAEQVHEGFRFSVKASRRITHIKRLKEPGEETRYLLDTIRHFGPALGVVLYQLPPNFKKDMERLREFLEVLGPDIRSVFEFRHETWQDEEVHDLLRKHNCALCLADVDDEPEPELVSTADFGYLRLRRMSYDAAHLKNWMKKVKAQKNWKDAFVFFKHEDAGAGPALAKQFLGLA